MKRPLFSIIFVLACLCNAWGQVLRTVPEMSAQSGSYDDQVDVTCTFPEGCAGGKYWINGGELRAVNYTEPIHVDYSCSVSVAGVDAHGRIITDVVTREYTINRVTPPTVVPTPAEGVRSQSFYVTYLQWTHVTRAELDLSAFHEGGNRHGEKVVWLTNASGKVLASGDYNSLWVDGTNRYKAYLYKDYNVTTPGQYVLHIASGVFVLDGKRHQQEVQLNYEVSDGGGAPVITPASGEYKGSVTVTISYPTDGSAFYQFYKLGSAKAKSYSGPLTLTESTTVTAYGMNEEFSTTTPSATATYTIVPADPEPQVLAAPKISRQGNTLTITGPQGATLKYWTNHNMSNAQLYTAPLTVDHNMHIACVAYTEGGISPTVEMEITDLPQDRGGMGEMVLMSPLSSETAHLRALSPNGRFAVGFMGSDTSSKGFIWDLESDEVAYQSPLFVNQLWSISDNGVAYGWRARTDEVDQSTGEEDLLWGTCQNGAWTEQPKGMTVHGISGSGLLYGQKDGKPATWNTKTQQLTTYSSGNAQQGDITAVNADGSVVAGLINGKACIWTAGVAKEYNVGAAVTALSADGKWAIIGQTHRLNVVTGELETLISTSDRASDGGRPELLNAITNDGTILGTYDASLLSPEKGVGLVRIDGRWRNVADWLLERGIDEVNKYYLTAVCDATGDGSTLLFHATTRGMSSDDTFTRGLVLRINVPVTHLAPGSLDAEQMSGLEVVKLTWKTPLTDGDQVKEYIVSRDGAELARLDNQTMEYYDSNVKVNETYTYQVAALYQDGVLSAPSRSVVLTCQLPSHLPARNISYRHVGYNDLALYWDAPVVSLPKLQYFDEESENVAFGTGSYDAEFGIRIPAQDLTVYEGQQIRTFQFLPTGPQRGYTLNLYHGNAGGGYEAAPFYSQRIDPSTLSYGTFNTIELTEAQSLTQGRDLYVGLLIESAGNHNMLGVSYDGFRSGYTDLCRIMGVHTEMVPMSTNSTTTTQVVLPLGVGIASESGYKSAIVSNYRVTDNGTLVATTEHPQLRMEQLSEGKHELAVTAIYRDEKSAEPASVTIDMKNNTDALVGVDVTATPQSDGTARLTWQAPRDWDRTLVHWGNETPQRGWEIAKGLESFMAISAYPVTMTAPYAGEYEISELYFCPTDEGKFEMILADEEAYFIASVTVENPKIGEINYVKLDEPIVVDPSMSYMVIAHVWDVPEGAAPLAWDTSNKWHDGMSNLINYGMGLTTMTDFLEYNETPNWFIGMVLQQREARELNVNGYHVRLDGNRVTNKPLMNNEFVTSPLADGEHTAAIEVLYPGKTAMGSETTFKMDATGVISVGITTQNGKPVFDLQGRRRQQMERGVNIMNNKKILK